jgi:hypothetical protein
LASVSIDKTTGVDFAEGDVAGSRLGDLSRKDPIGLPGLSASVRGCR